MGDDLRLLCKRFRVLIIGRRNAGKTTILEKMTGSEVGAKPEIRDKEGRLVDDPTLVRPGLERGMSVIDYEITSPCNPWFVFHESRGIDVQEPDPYEHILKFVNDRAQQRRIGDQLHAICA